MFRSSPLHVVSFQSGGKSDVKKNGEGRKLFIKSIYSFFFSFCYGQVVELAEK